MIPATTPESNASGADRRRRDSRLIGLMYEQLRMEFDPAPAAQAPPDRFVVLAYTYGMYIADSEAAGYTPHSAEAHTYRSRSEAEQAARRLSAEHGHPHEAKALETREARRTDETH